MERVEKRKTTNQVRARTRRSGVRGLLVPGGVMMRLYYGRGGPGPRFGAQCRTHPVRVEWNGWSSALRLTRRPPRSAS